MRLPIWPSFTDMRYQSFQAIYAADGDGVCCPLRERVRARRQDPRAHRSKTCSVASRQAVELASAPWKTAATEIPAPGLVSTRRVPLQVPAGLSSLVKIRQNIEPGGFSAKNQKKLAREPPARILSVILTASEQSAAVRKPVRPPRQAAWPVRPASKTSLRGKP